MCRGLYLSSCIWMISYSQASAAADPLWKVNELVNDVKTKPIGALVTELTQRATGEFDKLYHELEGVLRRLTGEEGAEEAEAQLDPRLLSECSCYCRCPHDSLDSKVVAEVKDSVLELKKRVESVGKSLRDKIHEITAP